MKKNPINHIKLLILLCMGYQILKIVVFQDLKKQFQKSRSQQIQVLIHSQSQFAKNLYEHDMIQIYPKNPEFRQYQYSICLKCVCYNTLVCLPTGLGKTHIASVLILNFSQWFSQGKIFFLAPTKPLVFQQKKSLRNFSEYIKEEQIAEMNGSMPAKKRQTIYQQKKIFFCTPQTFENDLKHQRIDGSKVVFIIFDEAHRGIGNYSYCKIVELMEKYKNGYRIVALSATPGNEEQKIQQVITNLHISKLQVRQHSDPDVACYLFTKQIKEVVIKPTNIINKAQKILLNFLVKPYNHLIRTRLIDPYIIKNHSFYPIMMQFNQKIKYCSLTSKEKAGAYASLKFIKFILDARRSLRNQGYETFKNKFLTQMEKYDESYTKQQKKIKQLNNINQQENVEEQLLSDQTMASLAPPSKSKSVSLGYRQKISRSVGITELKQLFKKSNNMATHPKLQKLKEMLQDFYMHMPVEQQSKVIIFVQFRATALQVKTYLNDSKYIKSQLFHGQSKSKVMNFDPDFDSNYEQLTSKYNEQQQQSKQNRSETTLYMNQKQQIELLKKFTKNQINTLISTSIGQQGLDIGEVDCIFCYDGGMSPIRMIQRMGRTGRKRHGKVFILLMEGKQYNDYIKANQKSKKMKQTLKVNANKFSYYGYNPTVLPQMSQINIELVQNVIQQAPDSQEQIEKQNNSQLDKTQEQQNNSNEIKQQKIAPKKKKKQSKRRKSKIKEKIMQQLSQHKNLINCQTNNQKNEQSIKIEGKQQQFPVQIDIGTNNIQQIISKYYDFSEQKQSEKSQQIKQLSIRTVTIQQHNEYIPQNYQQQKQQQKCNSKWKQISQLLSQQFFQQNTNQQNYQPIKSTIQSQNDQPIKSTVQSQIQTIQHKKTEIKNLQLMSDIIDQFQIPEDNSKYDRVFSLIMSDYQHNSQENQSNQNLNKQNQENQQENMTKQQNLSFDSDQFLDKIFDLFEDQPADNYNN